MKTHHRQTRIRHGDREADVDEKLAPLILELWRADISTMRSCQRHSSTRKVWITFAEAVGAEAFLNIVFGSNRDARRRKWARRESWYFGQYDPDAGALPPHMAPPLNPGGWEFHASVDDDSLSDDGDRWLQDTPAFRIEIALLFPARDLKRVTRAVRAWNARRAPARRAR
jgi:hypothetical protein